MLLDGAASQFILCSRTALRERMARRLLLAILERGYVSSSAFPNNADLTFQAYCGGTWQGVIDQVSEIIAWKLVYLY
jgi:hypothetical protein